MQNWTIKYNKVHVKKQHKAQQLNFHSVLVVIILLQIGQVIVTGEHLNSFVITKILSTWIEVCVSIIL